MILRNRLNKCFSTIAVFSGGPQHDREANQIVQQLKKASKESISFVGVIGDKYRAQFDHVYASSSMLNAGDFQATRDHIEVVQDTFLNPYRTLTHYKNYQLLKQLEKAKLYDSLTNKRVDTLITVGNFSLMKRLYQGLNIYCKNNKKLKPPTIGFDLMNAFRRVQNEQFLDYLYYHLPQRPNNIQKYIFPSMCIGYEGLYRAFQHINQFNTITSDGSFNIENFQYQIGQMIKSSRSQFRNQYGISQDNFLTFFSPGIKESQIKFSFKVLKQSLSKFADQPTIRNVTNKQFFELLVPLPKDNPQIEGFIKSNATGISDKFKVRFIQESQKYGAMCASDYAILHNGQATVEAAACQLPATVIDSMSNLKAYFTYWTSGHGSLLNISSNYHGYQDLLGSLTAIPQKVKDLMLKHFQRPKIRYYYVKLYKNEIKGMLYKSGANPNLNVNETGLQTATKRILSSAKIYKSTDRNVKFDKYARRQLLHI